MRPVLVPTTRPPTHTPCKHIQRIQFELDAGRIPRPGGRLPKTAVSTHPPPDATDIRLVATLRAAIREREERIATVKTEIQVLQFVCDAADAIEDGEEFDLKQILSDDYGPASQR